MKTVLVIAYECVPFNRPGSTIGAQRPFQFAKHLSKFGWRAIVLCCDYKERYTISSLKAWNEELSNRLDSKMAAWDNHHSLIIPLPSLRYGDAVDKLWLNSVLMDSASGTFEGKPGFIDGIKRKVVSFLKLFRGDHSQSWQPVAHAAARMILKQTKINFVLAEHGPDAGVFVGWKLNREFGIPWGVDFRDPFSAAIPQSIRPLLERYYRHLLKSCSATFNVNPHWVELDRITLKRPSLLVTNGYDAEEFEPCLRTASHKSDGDLNLFYFGSVKRNQSFAVLFEAMRMLNTSDSVSSIIFTYYGPSGEFVRREAERYKVLAWVRINSTAPRNVVIQKAFGADVLILLSRFSTDKFFGKGFYPGKVFEYFALRKPIICVPGDHGLLDELLLEVGVGKSFDSPLLLSQYLSQMLPRKQKGMELPYQPLKRIDFYSRERQAEELTKHLDEYSRSPTSAYSIASGGRSKSF